MKDLKVMIIEGGGEGMNSAISGAIINADIVIVDNDTSAFDINEYLCSLTTREVTELN